MNDQVKNNTEIKERPGWGERISYGAGGVGIRLVVVAISSYLLVYYTNVAMLDIAAVSLILAVSKFIDGVSDVVIGHVVDNTQSKLGKARTWLLRMCLPFAVSAVLLFWVPAQWPLAVKYIYVFLMYNLVNSVFFTFMQISHLSLISLMSDDSREHGLLGNIHALSRNLGILIGGSLFVKLLNVFTDQPGNQNTQRGYTGALLVVCAVMVILTLLMVLFTRERSASGMSKADKSEGSSPKMLEALAILLKNKSWRVILICELLILIGIQTTMAGVAYFAMYVLHDMSAMSWLMATVMAPGVVIQLITPLLIPKLGKNKIFIAGLIISAAGLLGLGLAVPDKSLMIPANTIVGIGRGLFTGMLYGIVADIISNTREKTGKMMVGLGNAGLSAVDKIGMGLGGVLLGFALSVAGFDAALDAQGIAQPAAVPATASFMYIWFPMILYVVTLVIYVLFFDMYKKKAQEQGQRD